MIYRVQSDADQWMATLRPGHPDYRVFKKKVLPLIELFFKLYEKDTGHGTGAPRQLMFD